MTEAEIRKTYEAPYAVTVQLSYYQAYGDSCPSVRTLMERTGYSRRTVQYSLRRLESWGVIRRLPKLSQYRTPRYELSDSYLLQPNVDVNLAPYSAQSLHPIVTLHETSGFNPISFLCFVELVLNSKLEKGLSTEGSVRGEGLARGEGSTQVKPTSETSDAHQTTEDSVQQLDLPPQSQEPQLLAAAQKLWELYLGLTDWPEKPRLSKARIKLLNHRVTTFPAEKLEDAVVGLLEWHIPNGQGRIERALSKVKTAESHAERIDMMARKGKVIAKSRKVPGRVLSYGDFTANMSAAERSIVNEALGHVDRFIKHQPSPSPAIRTQAAKWARWLKEKHGVKAMRDPKTDTCNKFLAL